MTNTRYSLKKGLGKGLEGAILVFIVFMVEHWNEIIAMQSTQVKVVLGMSLAAILKVLFNFLKQYLKNRK